MGKIINYLDTQSDIQLVTTLRFSNNDLRTIELFFLLKGKAEVRIDDQSYIMKRDDILVVNKHECCFIETTGKEDLLFHFSISDFLLSQALEAEYVGFNCNSVANPNMNYNPLRQIIIEIIDLFLFENAKTNFLQISKVYQLLNELSSFYLEQSTQSRNRDERIGDITREIKERYYENITLSEMAELVHMDTAYFSKFFKKNLGMNFKDYLSEIRMNHAIRDLLTSDKTITRIAVDNGFFNTNSFNKKFKEKYAMTPSVYRKQNSMEKTERNSQSTSHVKATFTKYKENQSEQEVSKRTSLQIDVSKKEVIPIKETWNAILNVGEAEIVLNNNLRQHLTYLQENLAFKYGRIWGVFTKGILEDSLMEYEAIDEILDFLLEIGVLPWISMNKLIGKFKESHYFIEDWEKILEGFCRHILNRYGKQNVEQWKIELVANDLKDSELVTRYIAFYKSTYGILKRMIPNISVGGGNFVVTNEMDLASFFHNELAECKFDFYSFVLFPYSDRLVREKRNFQRVTDAHFLINQLKNIKKIGISKPLYISEWSNTVSRSNLLNDTLYKGAFIIKSLKDLFDQVDGLGYWLGTDLSQKGPKHHAFLSGGNGLINKNGLSKPAMHAMKFFNQLKGLDMLFKDERHLVAFSTNDEFFILGHQYVHPNSLYFLKDEAHLKLVEVDNFFEEHDSEEQLILSGISNGDYELRVFSCLEGYGDLFNEWKKFFFTKHLRDSDLVYLNKRNTPLQNLEEIHVSNHQLKIKKKLTTNEFYVINIKKRQ
jgi:xylan 1,4-beta-xylosidase